MHGLNPGLRAAVMGGADRRLLRWSQGTYANASGDRYIWDANGKQLFGPFAANVPAVATIGGKRYYQSEAAATNECNDLDSWTAIGAATITGSQTDPTGGTGAYLCEGVNALASNDVRDNIAAATFTNNAAVALSVFIKRVSTSGTLKIRNGSTADGEWDVDMSLLSDGWERLTSAHPAVTVVNAYTASGTGACVIRCAAASGGPLDFYLWRPQCEEAAYPSSPIEPGVTHAADSMLFTAAQVPTRMREGRWKFSTLVQGTQVQYPPTGASSSEFHFGAGGSTNGVRIAFTGAATRQVYDYRATTEHVLRSAATWSRYQVITTKLDTAAGEATIEGATTGNGTTTGTSWSGVILAGDELRVGRLYAASNSFSRGLISEPEAW